MRLSLFSKSLSNRSLLPALADSDRRMQKLQPHSHSNRPQQSIRRIANREFRSAHLVGICGSGMKALAELLIGLRWNVTGSDLECPTEKISSLQQRSLRIHQGHDARFLPPDTDVLIYSPAIGHDNPERITAAKRKIPQLSYSQMLGQLMQTRLGISIAGTHGKSTTTAMVACILTDAGKSPSAIVGAEICGRNVSGWAGDGDLFVVESCEYQRNFLDLSPRCAVILGIEPDHFDYYQNLADMQEAYSEFMAAVPTEGCLIVRKDCPTSIAAAQSSIAPVLTFGPSSDADWWATDVRRTETGSRFRVFYRRKFFTEISLQIPGRHNVNNALAAVAICHHLGVSAQTVHNSLQEFRGIARRFEHVGSWRGVTLIDDYAHHPTAVKATLQTAREKFGHRRIWCAFQPHQVLRTQSLLKEFSESFTTADEVLFVPIYTAREDNTDLAKTTVCELVARMSEQGQKIRFLPSLDQLIRTLEDETLPGDVLITMGAGDIDRVQHEFTRRLQRNHSAR